MTSAAFAYSDLRDWIHEAERIGKLKHVMGAHWDKEIGCISELMAERDTSALLFDEIPGYPKGFRVLSNAFIDLKTTALVLGAAEDSSRIEMVDAWRQRLKAATPLCSVNVGAGPVTEHVLTGPEADLLRFPAPLWHEKDGGRFLGTGCAVVAKDLDDGWVNVGTYRCRVVDHHDLIRCPVSSASRCRDGWRPWPGCAQAPGMSAPSGHHGTVRTRLAPIVPSSPWSNGTVESGAVRLDSAGPLIRSPGSSR